MENFGLSEMHTIQKELQEKYKEKWGGLSNDVMLCYSISPEEIKKVYLEKHNKNMERW